MDERVASELARRGDEFGLVDQAEAALDRARRALDRAERTRERIQKELDEATDAVQSARRDVKDGESAYAKAQAERDRLSKKANG